MKQRILRRCFFGAQTGLLIFICISLIFAHLRGDGEIRMGHYLIKVYGSEVNAATALVLSAMVIGMIWSVASLCFETDWNMLMQTVVHAACCVIPSMAIAWAMYWIPRSWDGIVQYTGIFCLLYAAIWMYHFFTIKVRLKKINAELLRYTSEAEET